MMTATCMKLLKDSLSVRIMYTYVTAHYMFIGALQFQVDIVDI